MFQLFSSINHCHASGVIHRDIKPENIMLTGTNQVRLIDFGLSKMSKQYINDIAGTPYYMAPEVLEGSYKEKADIWSLGVLLYVLVSGYLPFQGANSNEVFIKIKAANYHFNHEEFNRVSKECKDLIQKLLVVNPAKRLNGVQALKHPWFDSVKRMKEDPTLSLEIIERFKSFKGVSHFKRAAMNMLVKTISQDELVHLREEFQKMDLDGSGMIRAKELNDYLQSRDLKMSSREIQELINEIDYQGNGKINYSEFLSATINYEKYLTE